MSLKDFVPLTRVIDPEGINFEVKGIDVAELAILQASYPEDFRKVFESEKVDLLLACNTANTFVSHLILLCCLEEDVPLDKVKRLPLGIKAEALMAIWEISLPDEKTLGKFLAWILRTFQQLGENKELDDLKERAKGALQKDPA